MINVLFVSQCKRNALKNTQIILDSFAERIGEKTWQTFTTYQYLDKYIKELKKKANKNTSVIVYILKKNRKVEYAKIGNTKLFYDGVIAHQHSKNIHNFFNIYEKKYIGKCT